MTQFGFFVMLLCFVGKSLPFNIQKYYLKQKNSTYNVIISMINILI